MSAQAADSIRSIIITKVAQIADQHDKTLVPLTDDLHLLNSGLGSLCIAILVGSLDDTLGIDPFERDGNVAFPVMLGDFIKLYENVAV